MRVSFKFRHLLSLSVLAEALHRPHFRFRVRRKVNRISLRYWSDYGITIYKLYHWQKGKIWSSYYAVYSGKRERAEYDRDVVSYAMVIDDLFDDLYFILWKYGNFMDYLDDMYDDDDFTDDDIPDDLELDIPF